MAVCTLPVFDLRAARRGQVSFSGVKMKFADFVCFEATVSELKAKNRDEAISELVRAIEGLGRLKKKDCDNIIRALIDRENEASTGLGKGVAVPHVKHPAIKQPICVVGRSSLGIDFTSLDKQLVYTVLLLLSPVDEPEKHLEAMEKIFRHLQQDNFRKFLRQSESAEQINELLTEADEKALL
jgi:mannitol/fructose-specific phosphotransferase system IIA component (Ntr-type)